MRLSRRYRPIGSARPGAGRSAVVAQDRVAGGTCVLKLAPAGSQPALDLVAEGALLADLEHPRLVELTDRFEDVLDPWEGMKVTGLATRWVDGLPLSAALAEADLGARLVAFGQLVDATAYLHRRGLLHLDLKPDNALHGTAGLVLLDLGSARPLDAGPGEAGGTLGYAAPEVLAGQAASVAADVFSLGAILYELLTGARAFGALEGGELRRAALAGEFVPVRAAAPRVPPALARLAEQMLALDPAARPESADAVAEALGAAGHPVELSAGTPPFVGRDALLQRLRSAVEQKEGLLVSLVGERGSGRSRLARRALCLRGQEGGLDRTWFDLSAGTDPLRFLDGLACATGADIPARTSGAPWIRAVAAGLEAWPDEPPALYLGRREDHPGDTIRTLDALAPALVAGGFVVIEATAIERQGALPIRLGPLEPEAATALARFYGLVGSARLRELMDRTGGVPAALIRVLAPARRAGPGRLGPAADTLSLLATLPSGIPDTVLEALELPAEDLARLEERRLLRKAANGRWYVEAGEVPPPSPELGERLAGVLARLPEHDDPTWYALALARAGALEEASTRFSRLDLDAGFSRSVLVELTEILSETGHRRARVILAGLREEDGDLAAAAELLEGLKGRSPDEELRLVRVLRRGGRADEAEALARRGLADLPTPALWLELAHIHLSRGELAEAETACSAAELLDAAAAETEALALRVGIAARRLSQGEQPAGLEGLMDRVEALGEGLDSATLSSAGRILTGLGQLDRGERVLHRAAVRADQEGDARRSAGIRLNRGNALQSLGRGRDARYAYREALTIAEGTGDTSLLLRIRYSLADLELRSGRLPAAETQVRAFQVEASRVLDPEVKARASELRGRLLLARGQPAEALSCLGAMEAKGLPVNLRISRDLTLAQALLDLGRADEVLPLLDTTPRSRVPTVNAFLDALRGRAHLSIARRQLSAARAVVPDEPDPLVRLETGAILLAAAGEDLDPTTFGARRRDLDRAARMLRGGAAADAATLRDRLLEGPGANLEGVVQLTEAMHDPQAFPTALASLVGQALGAYRVLIMVAIPGLGRQITYTELSGSEAAGIGQEVLRRIKKPEDYWLAHNAFADPHLRQTSQTVRTFELKSLLAVAIPQGDKAVGALYVDDLHRTNRFSEDDVRIMQRLARGVGRMLPLLSTGRKQQLLPEPTEILGLLLSDPDRVQEIEYAISMLRGHAQTNVLITGPTGAGKSVLARRLAVEVLGLKGVESLVLRTGDPNFLITQLAGLKKGEVTNAAEREGAIERCLRTGKALFLDEVQNLDENGQQSLLQLLELPQRTFNTLTSPSVPVAGNLHIILGTNADVSKGRWQEHFREDLWYRMSAIHIDLPSLQDRGSEAVYRYLARMLDDSGAPSPEEVFETAALHRVTSWSWPGNLRQLQRFAERAAFVYTTQQERIRPDQLHRLGVEDPAVQLSVDVAAEGMEQAMIEHVWGALQRTGFIQKEAARRLKWNPARLNKFLKRHELLDEVARQRDLLKEREG